MRTEDDLRRAITEAAGSIVPSDIADSTQIARRVRRERGRRLLATLAAVAVIGGSATVISSQSGGDGQDVKVGGPPSGPTVLTHPATVCCVPTTEPYIPQTRANVLDVVAGEVDVVTLHNSAHPARLLLGRDGGSFVDRTPSGGWQYFASADFVDARHGWVIAWHEAPCNGQGSVADLLRTTDGGHTWQSIVDDWDRGCPKPYLVHDLTFIDAVEGWSVTSLMQQGHAALLRHTVDGGRTWADVSDTLPIAGNVRFLTPTDGIVVPVDPTAAHLMTTHDGGRSWHDPHLPDLADNAHERVRIDTPTIINDHKAVVPMLLTDGDRSSMAIYETTDRGASWVRRAFLDKFAPRPHPWGPLAGVLGDDSAWWVMGAQQSAAVLYRSTDQGHSWVRMSPTGLPPFGTVPAPTTIYALWAFSRSAAWVWIVAPGGDPNAPDGMYETRDGGHTWHLMPPDPGPTK